MSYSITVAQAQENESYWQAVERGLPNWKEKFRDAKTFERAKIIDTCAEHIFKNMQTNERGYGSGGCCFKNWVPVPRIKQGTNFVVFQIKLMQPDKDNKCFIMEYFSDSSVKKKIEPDEIKDIIGIHLLLRGRFYKDLIDRLTYSYPEDKKNHHLYRYGFHIINDMLKNNTPSVLVSGILSQMSPVSKRLTLDIMAKHYNERFSLTKRRLLGKPCD